MNESPETIDLKPNHDNDNVSVEETGKRSLDESEDVDESKQHKLCKINDESDTDQSTLSKRQLKKIHKQQLWMEKKAKRK